MPDLSVVIPVHDEEAILRPACLDLMAGLAARGLDYEVVLCENGSRDGTRAELARLAAEHPRLRWLSLGEPNYGLALRQGILGARGRLVVCDEIDLCDLSFYDRALRLAGEKVVPALQPQARVKVFAMDTGLAPLELDRPARRPVGRVGYLTGQGVPGGYHTRGRAQEGHIQDAQ